MKLKVGNKVFDVADADLQKALEEKATEVVVTTDEVMVRTKEEDDTYVENHKKEARKEGEQIAVKAVRDEMGLTFTGKTVKNLVEAVVAKATSETTDEKVKDLTTKLEEKNTALKTALTRAETAESTAKQTQTEYKIDKMLDTYLPKNTLLPGEDMKIILKSKFDFKENENGVMEAIDRVTGKVVKNNTTADAYEPKDVIENFFRDNTKYINPNDDGNGGGNSGGGAGVGGKLTIEKFNEKMVAAGIAVNSEEYDTALDKEIAAKTIDLEA